MEITSVCLECPEMWPLIDDLETRFDDYCYYEVFDYAAGNVVVIAVQLHHHLLANIDPQATIVLDFTCHGQCRIDILSGDLSTGLQDTSGRPRATIHQDVIGFLEEIAGARGWRLSHVTSQ